MCVCARRHRPVGCHGAPQSDLHGSSAAQLITHRLLIHRPPKGLWISNHTGAQVSCYIYLHVEKCVCVDGNGRPNDDAEIDSS